MGAIVDSTTKSLTVTSSKTPYETLTRRVASTPTYSISSLYVWIPWRRCCRCCGADQRGGQRDQLVPLRGYARLFFRCTACLTVTIHDPLLVWFLGWMRWRNFICPSVANLPIPPTVSLLGMDRRWVGWLASWVGCDLFGLCCFDLVHVD